MVSSRGPIGLKEKVFSRALSRFEDLDDLEYTDMTPLEFADHMTSLRDSQIALKLAFDELA